MWWSALILVHVSCNVVGIQCGKVSLEWDKAKDNPGGESHVVLYILIPSLPYSESLCASLWMVLPWFGDSKLFQLPFTTIKISLRNGMFLYMLWCQHLWHHCIRIALFRFGVTVCLKLTRLISAPWLTMTTRTLSTWPRWVGMYMYMHTLWVSMYIHVHVYTCSSMCKSGYVREYLYTK